MNYQDEGIKPKDIYRPFKARPLTTEGQLALLHLYQPILGSDGVAVYFSLLQDHEDPQQEEFLHMDALTALDMGLPRFLVARQRLEGSGLLKVYVKNTELGQEFLYELLEPLAPSSFFQDFRYCQMLLEKVSQHKFDQLLQRFAPKKVDRTSYRQITKDFQQVYGKQETHSSTKEIQETIEAFQGVEDQSQLPIHLTGLDWQFISDFAEKEHLPTTLFTKEFRKQLTFYHDFYGYQEMELVDLVADAYLLGQGEVKLKDLNKLAEKKAAVPKAAGNEKLTSADENSQLKRKNTLLAQGFTQEDWLTIQAVESYPPLKYLQGLKKAKRSFVTKNEEWLLKDLVEKSPLPNPVINQLMNYVLVDQNNSDLNTRLVNKIATDWSEKQLKTPEDAIYYVRSRKQEQENKPIVANKKTATNYQKRPQKKEVLEDWTQYKTQTNPQLEAELDRKMKEFLKEGDQ